MKKILIIYSTEGELDEVVRGIEKGASANGHQIDVLSTDEKPQTLSFHPYDLVLVGSPTKGLFKGKIAGDIDPFLRDCKRTEAQDAVAFVTPRFFATTKSLKKLMGVLEKQGCFVKNFVSLKTKVDAFDFGKKL
ncbi:MAG: DNA-binding response regulator [Halothermotrichaceae bacterium]